MSGSQSLCGPGRADRQSRATNNWSRDICAFGPFSLGKAFQFDWSEDWAVIAANAFKRDSSWPIIKFTQPRILWLAGLIVTDARNACLMPTGMPFVVFGGIPGEVS